MAIFTSISGLSAAQTYLDVTGHNIANASTVGFKNSRAEFADVYSRTMATGCVSSQVGQGTYVTRAQQLFKQGSIDITGNSLDMGISGDGFFVTRDPDGSIFYTRAGQFSVDRDGFVENAMGRRLQIFPLTSADPYDVSNATFATSSSTAGLSDLELPSPLSEPRATANVVMALNLDSTETVPGVPFNPANPASYNHSTATTLHDSLGQAHPATMYFAKTGTNSWEMHVYADDGTGVMQPATGSPVALTFDADGKLTNPPQPGVVPLSATTANGSTNPIAMNWDIGDLTQYGNSFDVNNLTQDGFAPGRLTSIDVDNTGVVTARYTNGRVRALGQLALANFNNLQGLAKVGDTAWQETFASGEVRIGAPGTSNFGGISAGALETSNTDVAAQMVDLILAQRNYQANAQAVSTEGTLIQTLLNIR